MVENKNSSMVKNKISSTIGNKVNSMIKNKISSIFGNQVSFIVKNKISSMVENKATFMVTDIMSISHILFLFTTYDHTIWEHILYHAFLFIGTASKVEKKLVYDLIEKPGYNPLIRPVQNASESVKIEFGVTLFQVISVDERTQVMKTNNWIRMVCCVK